MGRKFYKTLLLIGVIILLFGLATKSMAELGVFEFLADYFIEEQDQTRFLALDDDVDIITEARSQDWLVGTVFIPGQNVNPLPGPRLWDPSNPKFHETGITAAVDVPIPGAVWLLGSGLVGLVGLRRKLRS